jgi:aryl-alcohol dehydrogenase-like predicted oxidoreductase
MRYGRLGDSGLAVSVVGLGCNNFGRRIDRDASHAVVDTAIAAGVTLFDTADSYGTPPGTSEQFLGEAVKGRRDDVIVATKFGHDLRGANGPDWGARGSRRYVLRAVEASLRRLNTDWIDLYQLHYPDEETPVEGKVRYIGCSNVAGWQVADAAWTASSAGLTGFISVQNEYSLLDRSIEAEVVLACERFGLGVLPYFPLAQGLLTGKFRRGEPAAPGTRLANRPEVLDRADWDVVEALAAFAEERDMGLLDVAVGWLAAQPAVASVIAGATRPEQVRANVAAAEWIPSVEDLAALDAITAPQR